MIDCYGFFGAWPYWDVTHKTPESLLELMDRHQINMLALCSTRSIFSDWRLGNEEAIALADKHPKRFLPFVSLSPILPKSDLVRHLKDYKSRKVKGIRLYPQHQGYSLTLNSAAAGILETAQDLNLPVVLPVRVIMNWGLPELDAGTIGTIVAKYPSLPFILSGVNYGEMLWAFDLARRYRNLSLEISGMQGFRAIDGCLQAVGPERLLFGSGLPLLYPACSVQKLTVARLSQEQRYAISEGNARRLLDV
jgi:predicted TIM-barrel fold metal-dependent hydrolase